MADVDLENLFSDDDADVAGMEPVAVNIDDETEKGFYSKSPEQEEQLQQPEEDDDLFGDTGDAMEYETEPASSAVYASLPDISFPSTKNSELYLASLPNFLEYESAPFDPEKYQPVDGEDDLDDSLNREKFRLRVENTIRWRFKDQTTRESNARMIRWSDGSLSLLLGEEMFEVIIKSVADDHQYIVANHPTSGHIQAQAKADKVMTFRPQNTNSMTHKKLTMAIASKHRRETKAKMFTLDVDPEKLQQEAEKVFVVSNYQAENERLKARRKLENARRTAAIGRSGTTLREEDLEAEDFEKYRRGNNELLDRLDEYEEDDFVVDDDEAEREEEQRRRDDRILKAKREERFDSEDESEDEAELTDNDADGTEDDEAVVRSSNKKRAIFDSDDD